MLKKLLCALCYFVCSTTLFIFIITFSVTHTLRPTAIKHWVAGSGIYNSAVEVIVNQAKKDMSNPDNSKESSGLKPTDPAVQTAIREALPPSFLQSSFETIVDGVFGWTDGKTAQPNFRIDLSAPKTRFADSLSAYAKQRYATLPACKTKALPADTDALSISCKPLVAFDINQQVEAFRQKVITGDEIIPKNSYSASDLTVEQNGQKVPIYQAHQDIPAQYQHARLVPLIAILLAAVSGAGVLFSSASKRKGAKRLSTLAITTGGFTLLLVAGATAAFSKVREKLGSSDMDEQLRKVVDSIAQSVFHDITHTLYLIGGLLLVGGIGSLIAIHFIRRPMVDKHTTKPHETHTPPTETPPAAT